MFKTTMIALATSAALFGAAVAVSAPAAANDHGYEYKQYHHNSYHNTYHNSYTSNWHYNSYKTYHNDYSYTYVQPEHQCYWVWKSIKVWSDEGPIWEKKQVKVCD